jgi:hypothetical protein
MGMKPIARARLMALETLRWFLALQPVRLAGMMRPIEVTNSDNML